MQSKTFKAKIVRDGSTCFIPLTFDPKAVFGKIRAPPADLVKALKALSAWDAWKDLELLAPARARRDDRRGQEARDTRASNREGGADGSVQEMKRDFLLRLKFGSAAWNLWRQENPDVAIVLDGAVLNGMILTGVNFSGVSLRRASLHATNLMNADLRGADLTGANLVEADLIGAQLHGAILTGANLHEADLLGADPGNARCSLDDLKGALHVSYPFEIRVAGTPTWTPLRRRTSTPFSPSVRGSIPADVVRDWGSGIAAQMYLNAMAAGEVFFIAVASQGRRR